VGRLKKDPPDWRREPILESKSFGSITSEFSIFTELEKPQIDPCYKESELDEDVGAWTEDDDEDVGYKEVDSGEGLIEY
jgi:hypothetical protein